MMRINIVTIFPDFFTGPLSCSIPKRAREAGLVEYRIVDLRDHTHDRHRTVDDVPFGGGAGMVMKPEPFFEALDELRPSGPVTLLSARGRLFQHADAMRYSVAGELTLLCGHYKDVDQRVADHLATEEISLGDFVLSGGEIAALALIDACVRILPGVMGAEASGAEETFAQGLLEYPHYTRPQVWEGRPIPDVLVSGDHAKVAAFRRAEAERLTRERRPDLWAKSAARREPE
jgi:tRNA (guanine37-N1)-methyltransferase